MKKLLSIIMGALLLIPLAAQTEAAVIIRRSLESDAKYMSAGTQSFSEIAAPDAILPFLGN